MVLKRTKKVVSYYTQCHFTAGAFTSQRSESLNAMLKLWGELKKSMTRWNIFEIFAWVDFRLYLCGLPVVYESGGGEAGCPVEDRLASDSTAETAPGTRAARSMSKLSQ
jgi:hypothetical protein